MFKKFMRLSAEINELIYPILFEREVRRAYEQHKKRMLQERTTQVLLHVCQFCARKDTQYIKIDHDRKAQELDPYSIIWLCENHMEIYKQIEMEQKKAG